MKKYPVVLPEGTFVARYKQPVFSHSVPARQKRGTIGWVIYDGIPISYWRNKCRWNLSMGDEQHPSVEKLSRKKDKLSPVRSKDEIAWMHKNGRPIQVVRSANNHSVWVTLQERVLEVERAELLLFPFTTRHGYRFLGKPYRDGQVAWIRSQRNHSRRFKHVFNEAASSWKPFSRISESAASI